MAMCMMVVPMTVRMMIVDMRMASYLHITTAKPAAAFFAHISQLVVVCVFERNTKHPARRPHQSTNEGAPGAVELRSVIAGISSPASLNQIVDGLRMILIGLMPFASKCSE